MNALLNREMIAALFVSSRDPSSFWPEDDRHAGLVKGEAPAGQHDTALVAQKEVNHYG